jgi:hypothetical protein
MTVLYVNPVHRPLWSVASEFERQPSTEGYTIYRNQAGC